MSKRPIIHIIYHKIKCRELDALIPSERWEKFKKKCTSIIHHRKELHPTSLEADSAPLAGGMQFHDLDLSQPIQDRVYLREDRSKVEFYLIRGDLIEVRLVDFQQDKSDFSAQHWGTLWLISRTWRQYLITGVTLCTQAHRTRIEVTPSLLKEFESILEDVADTIIKGERIRLAAPRPVP
ncbi:MAG: hypothetical protein KAI17_03420 [Thiotrichaceae bacterium]|nr:hypothetical protein [Thiotrichaceae bacterium]